MNSKSKSDLINKFPTALEQKIEIINLEAILSLPKPTDAFISDVHGEYSAFQHIVRTGAGNLKQKLTNYFSSQLTPKSINQLAFIIYYPEEEITKITNELTDEDDLKQWYLTTLDQLIQFLQFVSAKYTKSKVRKTLNPKFQYITEELMNYENFQEKKIIYYKKITENVISAGLMPELLISLSEAIQKLIIDHLYLVGDIYDRGPFPDKIIDFLISEKKDFVDITWGNHDILWYAAYKGSLAALANLIRISARYNNLDTIEDAYQIDLSELKSFAKANYQPTKNFSPKLYKDENLSTEALEELTQIQAAMAIIQFKLDGQAIERNPNFEMQHRKMFDHVNFETSEIELEGKTYALRDFPSQLIDPKNPYELTTEEIALLDHLQLGFKNSSRLSKHMDFIRSRAQMYQISNGNLILHGCIPVDSSGDFLKFKFNNHEYGGFELLNFFNSIISKEIYNQTDRDLLWYLWTGPISPLFGKAQMTTFERYFIEDPSTYNEINNPYYNLRKKEWFVDEILNAAGLSGNDHHIISGHTPVAKGETPVLANKKMILIDGGMSKPFQAKTGIGGYTLLHNSFGLQLVTHQPFTTKEAAIDHQTDIISTKQVIDQVSSRTLVNDTDTGAEIKRQIIALKNLIKEENAKKQY